MIYGIRFCEIDKTVAQNIKHIGESRARRERRKKTAAKTSIFDRKIVGEKPENGKVSLCSAADQFDSMSRSCLSLAAARGRSTQAQRSVSMRIHDEVSSANKRARTCVSGPVGERSSEGKHAYRRMRSEWANGERANLCTTGARRDTIRICVFAFWHFVSGNGDGISERNENVSAFERIYPFRRRSKSFVSAKTHGFFSSMCCIRIDSRTVTHIRR